MKIKASERKPSNGTGNAATHIGYFKGSLITVNPTAAELKKIYELDEEPVEPEYQGSKEEKDWAIVKFLFKEEITGEIVPYTVFLSKELAEYEKDGVTYNWYVNQWGQTQTVSDKKDLFKSFTHMQKRDKDTEKWEDVLDEDGKPIELSWRKAWSGETALYSLLRKLVTQNWFEADQETSLFIKFDELMRGKVTDISKWIGSENYQSVVGMIEVTTDEKDGKTYYNQNCVPGAWMGGWKCKEANIITQHKQWSKYEDKSAGKGKGQKEFYEFYQAVKRSKHTTDWAYMHTFNPDEFLATSNKTIAHAEGATEEIDTDYDSLR